MEGKHIKTEKISDDEGEGTPDEEKLFLDAPIKVEYSADNFEITDNTNFGTVDPASKPSSSLDAYPGKKENAEEDQECLNYETQRHGVGVESTSGPSESSQSSRPVDFLQGIFGSSLIIPFTGGKIFGCDMCVKAFSRKCDLERHIRTHTGEKPFECKECLLTFSQASHLKNHQRTHTGEKPFACDECKQTFYQKSNLTIHQKIHTKEKMFECGQCLKAFLRKGDLKRHQIVHTGEKPFECDVCQLAFSQKCHLMSHLRTHTGEKPFQCDQCNKRFWRRYELKCHEQTHNKGKRLRSE